LEKAAKQLGEAAVFQANLERLQKAVKQLGEATMKERGPRQTAMPS
jgi:hypothetical protein